MSRWTWLRWRRSSGASAPVHGRQRLNDDFDIEEVVAEYNILRGCIHDLVNDWGIMLQGAPFHVIKRVFDQAIGTTLQAVTNDLRTSAGKVTVESRESVGSTFRFTLPLQSGA